MGEMRREHWCEDRLIPLPELEGLTEDDRAYLRSMLAFAETGAMFRGRYVEAHVARLLGAVFPSTGTNAWDLMVPGRRPVFVEVKASRSSGSFQLGKFFDGTEFVWVFVAFDTAEGARPGGFRYAVGGPGDLERCERRPARMKVSAVFDVLGQVPASGLRAAVLTAGRTPSLER